MDERLFEADVLVFQVGQRIIKIEAEQAWVLSDHRCRDNIENVIVSFFGNFVAMAVEQSPEVALSWIGRHAPHKRKNLIFSPVIASHDENAGSLGVGGVQVFQV